MTRRRATVKVSDESLTHELLDWLGLPADAGPEDIEAAHDRLATFLDSAPPDLRSWARQQATAADAAFAVLSGKGTQGRLTRIGGDRQHDEPATDDGCSDLSEEFDEDYFDEDNFDLHEEAEPGKGTGHGRIRAVRARRRAGQRTSRAHPGRPMVTPRRSPRRSGLISLAIVAIIAAVVYGVYQIGGDTNTPESTSATPAPTSKPLDEAKVAALMDKLKANPADVETLRALGSLYFDAGDYKTAASWQQKIVDLNPNDISARLALGVALFNTGDTAGAEQQWRTVTQIDPKQAEAYYNLGFLYLSKNPPDTAKAKAEWTKVLEIDPNSELAKTVSTHINNLDDPAFAGPSPTPSVTGQATP